MQKAQNAHTLIDDRESPWGWQQDSCGDEVQLPLHGHQNSLPYHLIRVGGDWLEFVPTFGRFLSNGKLDESTADRRILTFVNAEWKSKTKARTSQSL